MCNLCHIRSKFASEGMTFFVRKYLCSYEYIGLRTPFSSLVCFQVFSYMTHAVRRNRSKITFTTWLHQPEILPLHPRPTPRSYLRYWVKSWLLSHLHWCFGKRASKWSPRLDILFSFPPPSLYYVMQYIMNEWSSRKIWSIGLWRHPNSTLMSLALFLIGMIGVGGDSLPASSGALHAFNIPLISASPNHADSLLHDGSTLEDNVLTTAPDMSGQARVSERDREIWNLEGSSTLMGLPHTAWEAMWLNDITRNRIHCVDNMRQMAFLVHCVFRPSLGYALQKLRKMHFWKYTCCSTWACGEAIATRK